VVSKEKINRINELARIAKERVLTKLEEEEQQILRKEYIEAFRKSFRKQLDNIELVD